MRVIDLFSGCGGMSLGFQNAGFQIVAAFDNWIPAIEIYKRNFTHPIFETDLSVLDNLDKFRSFSPDMIIGGPPCQDFSSAGKRNESGERGDLTVSFAKLVTQVKPKWFVMENVDRITKTLALEKAISMYKSTGYGLSSNIIDASYCNVPQSRKRFFIIGHLDSEDNFLNYYLEKNQASQKMTISDYLGNSLGIEFYYRHPRSYKRRGIFSIHEPSPTIRGVNRPVPKGYVGHYGDPIAINESIRPLTTIERSYLQTFPKDFKFFGSQTDLEQMIGNAVPVNLACYVAKCIHQYISDQEMLMSKNDNIQLSLDYLYT